MNILVWLLQGLAALARYLLPLLGLAAAQKVVSWSGLVAAMVALFATFFLAIKAVVAGVVYVLPNPLTVSFFWAIWPPSADICLAAYMTARVAVAVFRFHLTALSMTS